MGKRDIKIIIRSINELKEHLSSDEVQECVSILKEVSDYIDANTLKPLEVITNKYGIKNTNINGWLAQGGKFDESGEYEIELTKDDKIITIQFNVYSETTGKYDQDPTVNSQETETDIEIDNIMFSIPSDDQIDIPVTDEVKKYAINIISYNNNGMVKESFINENNTIIGQSFIDIIKNLNKEERNILIKLSNNVINKAKEKGFPTYVNIQNYKWGNIIEICIKHNHRDIESDGGKPEYHFMNDFKYKEERSVKINNNLEFDVTTGTYNGSWDENTISTDKYLSIIK